MGAIDGVHVHVGGSGDAPRLRLSVPTEGELRAELGAFVEREAAGLGEDCASYDDDAWRRRLTLEYKRLSLGGTQGPPKNVRAVVAAQKKLAAAREKHAADGFPLDEQLDGLVALEGAATAARDGAVAYFRRRALGRARTAAAEARAATRVPRVLKAIRPWVKAFEDELLASVARSAPKPKKAKAAPSAAQIAVGEARAAALAEAPAHPAALAAPRLPDRAALFAAADEDMARRTKAVERFGLVKSSSSFFVALSEQAFVYCNDDKDFVGKFRGDAAMQERFTGWTNPKSLIGHFLVGNRSVDGLEFRHWPEGLGAEALAAAFAHAGHPRYRGAA